MATGRVPTCIPKGFMPRGTGSSCWARGGKASAWEQEPSWHPEEAEDEEGKEAGDEDEDGDEDGEAGGMAGQTV